MMTGLGWRSLDPVEATAAVHALPETQLREVIYSARCAEARRVALVRLQDRTLTEYAALHDPAPLVRRRMVRELTDRELLNGIALDDDDQSVRQEAVKQLERLIGKENGEE